MSWEDRIISDAELRPYLNRECFDLAGQVAALVEQQKENWPMLAEGYRALLSVEARRVILDDSSVVVQHNPRRIRSTAARVDKASVEARSCFLCESNMPAEEKGIAYGDLVLTCNPFPILDGHLSIVHRDHTEQRIAGNVESLLLLARDLSPFYFVLYNGPESGASAPDHFHLQACLRALLPIEEAVRRGDKPQAENCAVCEASAGGDFEVFTLSDYGRSVIVLRGPDGEELAAWIHQILDALGEETGRAEPMINIVSTFDDGMWAVYMFPRARHRPACFFAEGDERLTISPGSIDMAGVLVVPDREHYQKVTSERIAAIFSEVSLSFDLVNIVVERVCLASSGEGTE